MVRLIHFGDVSRMFMLFLKALNNRTFLTALKLLLKTFRA